MAISNKVIDKRFIKDRVLSRLHKLNKYMLLKICEEYGVVVKKSALKDDIINAIKSCKSIDMYDIYVKYGGYGFSLSATELEELLGIDKTIRKKMEKKGLLEVDYRLDVQFNGAWIKAPYYSLVCLYKMKKSDLEEYKEKFKKKPLTEKQKKALERAREAKEQKAREEYEKEMERLREDTKCPRCGYSTMSFSNMKFGFCYDCWNELDTMRCENSAIEFCRDINKNKNNYLILDVETTDLNFNDICSLSIIDFNGNVKINTLIKPNTNISYGATQVHRIKNVDVENAPTGGDLKNQIAEIFNEDKIILYHSFAARALVFYMSKHTPKSFYENVKCQSVTNSIANFYNDGDTDYLKSLSKYIHLDEEFNAKDELHSLKDCFRIKKFIEDTSKEELRVDEYLHKDGDSIVDVMPF